MHGDNRVLVLIWHCLQPVSVVLYHVPLYFVSVVLYYVYLYFVRLVYWIVYCLAA